MGFFGLWPGRWTGFFQAAAKCPANIQQSNTCSYLIPPATHAGCRLRKLPQTAVIVRRSTKHLRCYLLFIRPRQKVPMAQRTSQTHPPLRFSAPSAGMPPQMDEPTSVRKFCVAPRASCTGLSTGCQLAFAQVVAAAATRCFWATMGAFSMIGINSSQCASAWARQSKCPAPRSAGLTSVLSFSFCLCVLSSRLTLVSLATLPFIL
jgi:hypothetical protein